MSREERMAILRMVQDGKITADEAASLLRAIETAEEREAGFGEAGDQAGGWSGSQGGNQGGSQSAGQGTGTFIPEGGLISEDLLQSIKQGLFGLFGTGHQFEEEITEDFAAEGPVRIDFASTNGRVEVKGWDGPGFKLHLVKTVRAADRAAAEQVAKDLVEVINVPGNLSVKMRDGIRGWNVGLTIEALLPRDRVGELNLRTSNGRIEATDFTCATCHITSSNGRIVAEGLKASQATLHTSNGSITANGLKGSVDAGTSNGSITVGLDGASGDVRLHTSNGSIRCGMPSDAATGVAIDARTSLGSITADVPNLEIIECGKHGTKSLRAHTRGFDTAANQVKVNATTSNGSITLAAR